MYEQSLTIEREMVKEKAKWREEEEERVNEGQIKGRVQLSCVGPHGSH